jgi:type III pantothenate kinase
MRLLAIDAGNTRIKWGLNEDGRWLARDFVPTTRVEALAQALRAWPRAQRVIIANVAGEPVAEKLAAALAPQPAPSWVTACAEQCGVRSSYAEPAQLGADRWAALVGARHFHEGPSVVVNAGTTMTVDALAAEGIFLGGVIVAGYGLMRAALARDTAQLALRPGRFSFFPDNTGDAIASGAINALAGAVERMVRYMVEAGEDEPLVLLSGGDAAVLEARLQASVRVVEHLVLEGLVAIATHDE